jgi:hypothetical protein
MIEDDEIILKESTLGDPTEVGGIRQVGGAFRMKDATGVFNPRSGGGGITEAEHELLDTLTHWVNETNWQEIVRSGGKVTNVINWETSDKLKKIRECVIARSGGKVSQLDAIQYDGSGVEKMRLTGVITRATGKVASIAWTKTVA